MRSWFFVAIGLVFVSGPVAAQTAAPPTLVALTGTAAPAGGNYDGFYDTLFNNSGQVAFLGYVTGGSSSQGIFAGAPGNVQAAGISNTAAPAGGNYSNFGPTPVLNASGQVAYRAFLTGG